jgi:sulfite exporter TauE/SafE
MFILAAITLGFLGSIHCIGMCGPIAMAVPVDRSRPFGLLRSALFYNAGRIMTYSMLGLLFGLLGQMLALAGLQSALSLSLGALILIVMLIPSLKGKAGSGYIITRIGKMKEWFRALFGTKSTAGIFSIGLLNGLLPCGMVYMAIAGATATGDTIKGSVFMAAFGAGTLPAMIAVMLLRDSISARFRQKMTGLVPVFVAMMAVMLILRGLNLGIPYLSPHIVKTEKAVTHECCHKPNK